MSEQAQLTPSVSVVAEYTEAHFRRATRRFMLRRFGWHYGLMLAVVVFLLPIIISRVSPLDVFAYALSEGLFPTAVAFIWLVGFFMYQYRKCLRANLAILRKLNPPQVAYTFTSDEIALTNSLASTRVNWTALSYLELWRYPDMWMLFINKHAWHTLPVENLDEQSQQFITEQVRAHGGKVR